MVDVYNPFMVIVGTAYYLLSSHWRTLIHLLAIELTVKQTHHLSHKGPSTHGSFLHHLNHNTFHSPLKFTILIDSPNGNLPQIKKKNLENRTYLMPRNGRALHVTWGSSHSIPMSPSCPHIVSYTPMVYPPVSSNLAAKSHQSTLIFPWNFLEKPLLIITRWFSMVFHGCPPYFPRFSMVFPICSAQIFP